MARSICMVLFWRRCIGKTCWYYVQYSYSAVYIDGQTTMNLAHITVCECACTRMQKHSNSVKQAAFILLACLGAVWVKHCFWGLVCDEQGSWTRRLGCSLRYLCDCFHCMWDLDNKAPACGAGTVQSKNMSLILSFWCVCDWNTAWVRHPSHIASEEDSGSLSLFTLLLNDNDVLPLSGILRRQTGQFWSRWWGTSLVSERTMWHLMCPSVCGAVNCATGWMKARHTGLALSLGVWAPTAPGVLFVCLSCFWCFVCLFVFLVFDVLFVLFLYFLRVPCWRAWSCWFISNALLLNFVLVIWLPHGSNIFSESCSHTHSPLFHFSCLSVGLPWYGLSCCHGIKQQPTKLFTVCVW